MRSWHREGCRELVIVDEAKDHSQVDVLRATLPTPVEEVPAEPDTLEPLPGLEIRFDFDSASLFVTASGKLEEFAQYVLASGASKILVKDYADERGDRYYNLALAHR